MSDMNFPGSSVVKNPPAIQEMWIQSLGQEDPLEKEMATHFSILAWKSHGQKSLGRLQSMRPQRVGHDLATEYTHMFDILKSELRIKSSVLFQN